MHRDVEILSEAFGRFLRLRLLAHTSLFSEAPKTSQAAEARYKQFAQAITDHFLGGHRFLDDLPNVADDAEGRHAAR